MELYVYQYPIFPPIVWEAVYRLPNFCELLLDWCKVLLQRLRKLHIRLVTAPFPIYSPVLTLRTPLSVKALGTVVSIGNEVWSDI